MRILNFMFEIAIIAVFTLIGALALTLLGCESDEVATEWLLVIKVVGVCIGLVTVRLFSALFSMGLMPMLEKLITFDEA